MGLLKFEQFSSIPTLKRKIQSRREQIERYKPNFSEWGLINGTQVIVDGVAAGVLFTVPEGDVLYITSAFVSARQTISGTGDVNLFSNLNGSATLFIGCTVQGATGSTAANSNSLNYSMPIRVPSNGTVEMALSATRGLAGFQGFTIPKSLEIV